MFYTSGTLCVKVILLADLRLYHHGNNCESDKMHSIATYKMYFKMKNICIFEMPLHFGSVMQTVFCRIVKTDGHHLMPSKCIYLAKCHNKNALRYFLP